MNKLNFIIHTLYLLRSSPTRTPAIDEEKILDRYRRQENAKSGIAIKVVSVFGGIAASLFFLAFLFLAGLYESGTGMLVFGCICIVAGIFVNSRFDSIIVDTASISFYIVGFFLIAIGLGSIGFNEYSVCLVFIGIALLTLALVQNYIFSFVSLLIINGSVMAMIIFNGTNDLIHLLLISQVAALVALFFSESFFVTMGNKLRRLYQPIRTGMLVSFICGLVIVGNRSLFQTSPSYMMLTGVAVIIALLYTAFRLTVLLKITKVSDKALVYGIAAIMCVTTVAAPSISGCLLIILLSFFVRHRGGFMLGLIALIYCLSQYYYDLNYSLLYKSYFLMGSGVVFLVIYLITIKKLTAHAKV